MSYGEILRVAQDYADYDLGATPNVARCRIHVKALRMLQIVAIRRSGQAARHEEVEVEPEVVERLLTKATAWLASYNAHVAGPRQVVPAPYWRDE